MRKIVFVSFLLILLIPQVVFSKTLDQAFSEIFSKLLKQFSYEGEVVAVLPERNEAAVQFENNFIPPIGAEVTVFRHQKKLYNQLTGKFIGYLDINVGIISIKDKVGTVALGDIVSNPGHIRPGDKVRFTKRVVIYLKSIKNLTEKPLQAYDVKSYLELAAGKFPRIQIITGNISYNMKNQPNVYYLNMKVFLKDTDNSKKKEVSVELSSIYTGLNVGEYSVIFDMSKKMLSYKAPQIQSIYPSNNRINTPSTNGISPYPGLPVYPMSGNTPMPPSQQLPVYPTNNNSGAINPPINPLNNIKPSFKRYQYTNNFTSQSSFKSSQNLSNPLFIKYREIQNLPQNIKSIDFNGNNIVYTNGNLIVFGKIFLNNGFRETDKVVYTGQGKIMNVAFVDANNNGFNYIIANIISNNGMESRIYQIVNNKLKLIEKGINLILGSYDFDNDGIEEFAGQTFNRENIFGASLFELKLKNNKLIKGKRAWIPAGFRLPCSIKADINNDGKKELIFINNKHKLEIYKNGENIYLGEKSLGNQISKIDPKPVIYQKNKILIANNTKNEVDLVQMNNIANISIKPFTGKINGEIKGITIFDNNLLCIVNNKKENRSSIIDFPLY